MEQTFFLWLTLSPVEISVELLLYMCLLTPTYTCTCNSHIMPASNNNNASDYITPGLEITTLQCYIVKTELRVVLATQNNLRVENTMQPVRTKDILYV